MRASQRGTKFGRPSKLSDYQRQEALARIANGERQADIARSYKVSPALICVLAKESIGLDPVTHNPQEQVILP